MRGHMEEAEAAAASMEVAAEVAAGSAAAVAASEEAGMPSVAEADHLAAPLVPTQRLAASIAALAASIAVLVV